MDEKSWQGIAITGRWVLGTIALSVFAIMILVMIFTYPFVTLLQGYGIEDVNNPKIVVIALIMVVAFVCTLIFNGNMIFGNPARDAAIFFLISTGIVWISFAASGISMRPEIADAAWDAMLWYFGISVFNFLFEIVYSIFMPESIVAPETSEQVESEGA